MVANLHSANAVGPRRCRSQTNENCRLGEDWHHKGRRLGRRGGGCHGGHLGDDKDEAAGEEDGRARQCEGQAEACRLVQQSAQNWTNLKIKILNIQRSYFL